jgi:uncharacterized protein YbjT (DUF2867 family)
MKILITGASGKVGRELTDLLVAGEAEVTAVTRDPARAALPEPAHVVPAPFYDGIDAMFLNLAAVGATLPDVLADAAAHGVRRAVLLSAITVEYGGGYRRFAEAFRAAEEVVRSSGLEWTFLRPSQFASNALVWAPQIRATGKVRTAYGEAAYSPIHPVDIAAVAALALQDEESAGQAYALTGPESLTQRDQVELIGKALGQPVEFEEITFEQAKQAMLDQGVPADIPDRMYGYLAECLAQPAPSTTAVADLLGRPALDFADWAIEHSPAFRAEAS